LLFIFVGWLNKKYDTRVCQKYTRSQLDLLARGQWKESGIPQSDQQNCYRYMKRILNEEADCQRFSKEDLILNVKNPNQSKIPYEYQQQCKDYAKRSGFV